MGVSKFLGTFGASLPSLIEQMRQNCYGVAIDMNQFIHQALEDLKESHGEGEEECNGITTIKLNESLKTTDELLAVYRILTGQVLGRVFNELNQITNLKDLYLTMDGTPCFGKLQNQIERRRKSKRFVTKTGLLLLSSAFILPGTPLMTTFTQAFLEQIELIKSKKPGLNVVLSSSDVPGEGEHKALDYLSSSSYTSFSTERQGWFMIWSNDSDVIISLLHRPVVNVYIMTDFVSRVAGQFIKTTKCVDLSGFRQRLCDDVREVQNSPILLMFQGNDYLPEMLNSFDIQVCYNKLKSLCRTELTKEIKPKQADQEAFRSIDFEALRDFLRILIEEEIQLYFPVIINETSGRATSVQSNPSQPVLKLTPGQQRFLGGLKFRPTVDVYLQNRTAFKREYYAMVYRHLKAVGIVEGTDSPTNAELYQLEMQMSLSYLKTFTWYFYYQSGFHTEAPLDNCYYSFCFPPLYSSLYIMLERAEPENMIQFDWTHNPILRPVRRQLDYFEKLKSFNQLHHYIVLQEEDFKFLYPTDYALFEASPMNSSFQLSKKSIIRCECVVNRVGQAIEISKRAPIELLIKLYSDKLISSGKVITSGEVAQLSSHAQANRRYALRGVAEL